MATTQTTKHGDGHLTPRARALVALRKWLDNGHLKPGDPIPPERELCRQLGVTLPTLHRATKALEIEGRLRVVGQRTRVVADPPSGQNKLLRDTIVVVAASRKPSPEHRTSGWFEYVSIGAFDAIEAAGYHALQFHSQRQTAADFDDLISARPLGVVLPEVEKRDIPVAQTIAQLRTAGVGICVFGDDPQVRDCDRVISDQTDGAAQLTTFLLARNRRRILQVLPARSEYWVHLRRQGYESTMRAAGLDHLPALTQEKLKLADPVGYDQSHWFDSMVAYFVGSLHPFITGPSPIDALLLASDGDVPVAAAACRRLGKEPNRDIFLAGYDNYWADVWERQYEPVGPLVTIDRNNPSLGQELVKLLISRLEGKLPAPPQLRLVKPNLVDLSG